MHNGQDECRDEQKRYHLHHDMQSPVQELCEELLAWNAKAGDEEDDGNHPVQDAVLASDNSTVLGHLREEVGQHADDSDSDQQPLVQDQHQYSL